MASTQVTSSQILDEPVTSVNPPILNSPTSIPDSPTTIVDSSISILDSPISILEDITSAASATSPVVTRSSQLAKSSSASAIRLGKEKSQQQSQWGVAVGAALGALVAGVLIVVLVLCIWRKKRKNRAKLSRLEAASSCHPESRRGPITPFDRFENAATAELTFIQKGLAEDQRRNPTASLVATDFPSEKGRLAAASTCALPVLDIRPLALEGSDASSATPLTPWTATPSNSVASSAVASTPMLPPSIATSPSQYSAISAFHYSHSATSPVRPGGHGLSPASPFDDPSSAVETAQRSPFDDPPAIDSDDTWRAGSLGQRTAQNAVDLDLAQYDLEVLQRAIQLVNAENRAGRMHGALLVEPPPAYQAGPLSH
ncbi:hypothetical protein BKA70DRAFT_1219354 [Coprinopsis sp. MPI-PUGE-AT-0042]|nr:hypothetical protein BKA70DRAFT_1219354 [Coprinopsis sp. MPI-PUGE-AT-0042]